MAEALYPAYRRYVDSRVEVNNAMMALLAGSRLAAHTLQLTEGSSATLPEVFPAVEHIRRFNLRSDVARDLLGDADYHLASVAVPYALATHEDYVTATLEWLKTTFGKTLIKHGNPIRAWNMHSIFFETCGTQEPEEWMQTFHVLREMRNCITHAGGQVDEALRAKIASMGADARAGWEKMNLGNPPEAIENSGKLALTAEHIFTAFAVTKQLGREVNYVLRNTLTPAEWAAIVVNDYAQTTSKDKNSAAWRRALIGYARSFYSPLGLHDADLEAAARQTGAWTRNAWS